MANYINQLLFNHKFKKYEFKIRSIWIHNKNATLIKPAIPLAQINIISNQYSNRFIIVCGSLGNKILFVVFYYCMTDVV